MATQEKKHIGTHVDMAGYRFARYAEWHLQGKDCDNDLLKALGGGSGPRELLKKVLTEFREEAEEVCKSDGSVSLAKIVQDLDKPLRYEPIGNLERLPPGYQETHGYYLDERLQVRRPQAHVEGHMIIYLETRLENEHASGPVAIGVCELSIKISRTKTVIVVPAHYPESSLGTPVPSNLSIAEGSASASVEIKDAKAELASNRSQRSKLKELLDWYDERIRQVEEGMSARSTGSSNDATQLTTKESLAD